VSFLQEGTLDHLKLQAGNLMANERFHDGVFCLK
jgi:hypothetical protein